MSASEKTVSLAACADYDPQRLAAAVDRLLAGLPDWDKHIGPGKRVLIKPNLLSDHRPDEAVTTHPELVRALVRTVRRMGAEVSVADSPASAVKLRRVWEQTGFAAMCEEERVPLLNLEKRGSRRVERDGFRFSIAEPVLGADAVLNVPKVKTHVLTTLTCGVKNLYGAVPGYLKAQLHKQYPRPAVFGRLLRAIFESIPPALTVADGIVGMEGDGPANGRPVALGFLAASTDAVALDICLCDLLGIPPKAVPYLAPEAGSAGAGIVIVGDALDALRPVRFKLPGTLRARLIPGWLVQRLSPFIWIRPGFNDACIRCGRCVQACPVEALHLPSGAAHPVLKAGDCIGCCCCHEVCPAHAIEMCQSRLLHAWGAFKELRRPRGTTR